MFTPNPPEKENIWLVQYGKWYGSSYSNSHHRSSSRYSAAPTPDLSSYSNSHHSSSSRYSAAPDPAPPVCTTRRGFKFRTASVTSFSQSKPRNLFSSYSTYHHPSSSSSRYSVAPATSKSSFPPITVETVDDEEEEEKVQQPVSPSMVFDRVVMFPSSVHGDNDRRKKEEDRQDKEDPQRSPIVDYVLDDLLGLSPEHDGPLLDIFVNVIDFSSSSFLRTSCLVYMTWGDE